MPALFKFLKSSKQAKKIPQIVVDSRKTAEGLTFLIYRDKREHILRLPLQLTITEMKIQENLPLLEALEELWYEEFLIEDGSSYILPYEKVYELPDEIKDLFGIPKESKIEARLQNEGAVGTARFKFILEKDVGEWKNIHLTGQQFGPISVLADGTQILINQSLYEFEKNLKNMPDPKNSDLIFPFIAQVIQDANSLNIPMNDYLSKQQYLFIDQMEVDVDASSNLDELRVLPKYKAKGTIADEILTEMSEKSALFYSTSDGQKVFVDRDIHGEAKLITELPSIKGADIPRFIDNPETFLPEIKGIDLSLFSERVRSLGIKVYKAQPLIACASSQIIACQSTCAKISWSFTKV